MARALDQELSLSDRLPIDRGIIRLWYALLSTAIEDIERCNGRADCPRRVALEWLHSTTHPMDAEMFCFLAGVDVRPHLALTICEPGKHRRRLSERIKQESVAKRAHRRVTITRLFLRTPHLLVYDRLRHMAQEQLRPSQQAKIFGLDVLGLKIVVDRLEKKYGYEVSELRNGN